MSMDLAFAPVAAAAAATTVLADRRQIGVAQNIGGGERALPKLLLLLHGCDVLLCAEMVQRRLAEQLAPSERMGEREMRKTKEEEVKVSGREKEKKISLLLTL